MANIAFVNYRDEVIGAGTREDAWKNGNIHRIVGVFIFDSKGSLLIQKRSKNVITSQGKWDQSAGGHVNEGEEYIEAAKRETHEELGIGNIELQEVEKYFTDEVDESGRIKKRFNMLYKTNYDGPISFNKEDVAEVRWISLDELQKWMDEKPKDFTGSFIRSLGFIRNKPFKVKKK